MRPFAFCKLDGQKVYLVVTGLRAIAILLKPDEEVIVATKTDPLLLVGQFLFLVALTVP